MIYKGDRLSRAVGNSPATRMRNRRGRGLEIQVLPLDSPRWRSFRTFFGTPEQVPHRVNSWQESIGSLDEDARWAELWEQFLHQSTITDAAYAALPHIVEGLGRIEPSRRLTYLVVLAEIETARQISGGMPELAPDLADSYHTAISRASRLAIECLSVKWSRIEFRYVLSVVASLQGHGGLGDLLSNLDCVCGECPKCGECVYPGEIQKSGYV